MINSSAENNQQNKNKNTTTIIYSTHDFILNTSKFNKIKSNKQVEKITLPKMFSAKSSSIKSSGFYEFQFVPIPNFTDIHVYAFQLKKKVSPAIWYLQAN